MLTMTDEVCVETYVKGLTQYWNNYVKNNRNGLGEAQRHVRIMVECISTVHRLCRIPNLQLMVTNNNSRENGHFNPSKWAMKVNYSRIAGPISEQSFIDLAETIYHEGRHAEQNWLIICWIVASIRQQNPILGSDASEKLSKLSGLPLDIAKKAINASNFSPSPELCQKIEEWHQSIIVKAYEYNKFIQDLDHDSAAYDRYRFTPHEVDAFNIQVLVRSKLNHFFGLKGRDIPIPLGWLPGWNAAR